MNIGSVKKAAPAAKLKIDRLKQAAVREALRKYGRIQPCGSRASVFDCFTIENTSLCLWFNTFDKSTHIVQVPLPAGAINSSIEKRPSMSTRSEP